MGNLLFQTFCFCGNGCVQCFQFFCVVCVTAFCFFLEAVDDIIQVYMTLYTAWRPT